MLIPLLICFRSATAAFRLATVRMASRAVVLDGGRIVEQGAVEALAGKPDGYLAGMVRLE